MTNMGPGGMASGVRRLQRAQQQLDQTVRAKAEASEVATLKSQAATLQTQLAQVAADLADLTITVTVDGGGP